MRMMFRSQKEGFELMGRWLSVLCLQAHFVHLSTRDEALARSLNADYVAQVSNWTAVRKYQRTTLWYFR